MRVNRLTKKTATAKIIVAMTDDMLKALEEERKVRKIVTVPEVVRIVISEYFKEKSGAQR